MRLDRAIAAARAGTARSTGVRRQANPGRHQTSLFYRLGWSRLRVERKTMEQAARRLTAKDTNEKLTHQRLTVLELAERLGNVSETWAGSL
jgi:hypothetical protein